MRDRLQQRRNATTPPAWAALARCRRGMAALEFALVSLPLLTLVFGFIATNSMFYTWSAMQSSAQFAARVVSTGQIKSLSTGVISASNLTATATCSGTLSSSTAEYHACRGLPSWATYSVTVTISCATPPSVTVNTSVGAAAAALANVYSLFSGQTLVARAVMMKEGACP